MRTKSLIWALAVVTMLAAACSKSEKVDPDNPNVSVSDPDETVTLSMRNANSGKTYLGDSNIYIDNADNFTGGEFVSLGAVKGLGNVGYIPKTGWVSKTAVVPGEGYVAYASGKFYRIYVSRYTTNIANEIIGAEIKYQTPFGGADEAVAVAEKSLTFESGGGEKELLFTNKSIIPCKVESEGCSATLIYADGHSYLPQGVRITAPANESTEELKGRVTITAANGNVTEVAIRVDGVAPYVGFGTPLLDVDYRAAAKEVAIVANTEIDYAGLSVASDAEWCKVSRSGDRNVTIRVEKNTTGEERKTTVTVTTKDGKLSGRMQVVQKSVEFSLSQSTLDYDRTSTRQSVTVLPIDFAVTAKSKDSWCTCSVISNVIEISVAANTTSRNRTTVVSVIVEGRTENITVNQSRYSVGDYYKEGTLEGVVYTLTTGFHGGILSLDETQAAWSTEKVSTGADDPDNGLNNVNKIRTITNWYEKYPAFAWCEAKNTNGVTGWYLPAKNELWTVYEGRNAIHTTLVSRGKPGLSSDYWSSSEYSSARAWDVGFGLGGMYNGSKFNAYRVRAVAAF